MVLCELKTLLVLCPSLHFILILFELDDLPPSSTLKSSLNLNLSPLQIKFLDQDFFSFFLTAILAEGTYSTNNCLFFKYLKKTLSIYHVANTISIFDHGDPLLYTRQSPGLS